MSQTFWRQPKIKMYLIFSSSCYNVGTWNDNALKGDQNPRVALWISVSFSVLQQPHSNASVPMWKIILKLTMSTKCKKSPLPAQVFLSFIGFKYSQGAITVTVIHLPQKLELKKHIMPKYHVHRLDSTVCTTEFMDTQARRSANK